MGHPETERVSFFMVRNWGPLIQNVLLLLALQRTVPTISIKLLITADVPVIAPMVFLV